MHEQFGRQVTSCHLLISILQFLPEPRDGRQTLLFSATIPKELVQIAPQILGSSFEFADAVALVSNSKSNKTAIRKEEASEAAPSHLRILVESVLHPFTAYPYLDPALLERYFSSSLEPQAAMRRRSCPQP
jgi:hypothetical protein